MAYKPYSIITPPYDPTSGGIKVMWGLYGYLLAKGHVVNINVSYNDPNFVGVYPEISHGNSANAKTVVRYILNKPGVMGSSDGRGNIIPGPTSFDKSDILFYFSRLYAPDDIDSNHIMFLPVINTSLFRDQRRKRDKTCVFVGKGKNTFIHPSDAIPIDRTTASDQGKLADLLNECHTMYGYDPVSAMNEVAHLCGVRVILSQDVYSRKEWEKYEPGMNGINWNKDEGIKLDTIEFREHYLQMIKIFEERLDYFIWETQKQ